MQAAQAADGTIFVGADSEAGVEHVRFVLGLEDDHSEFLSPLRRDPLLGESTAEVARPPAACARQRWRTRSCGPSPAS